MASYRLYYCNDAGIRFATDDFDAANDAAAVQRARVMVRGRCRIFEVWAGERRVAYRDLRPPGSP